MTNAELAILGLIAEKSRHGYEIEQVIEQRGMRDWTEIGFSSIYYLLKKLEQEGFVSVKLTEADRGPARKVYKITPAGYTYLRQGLLEALTIPKSHHYAIQLGLSNLPIFTYPEILSALEEYRESLQEKLSYLQAKSEAQKPLPYFVVAMFDHSTMLIQAEIAWAEQFTRKLHLMESKNENI